MNYLLAYILCGILTFALSEILFIGWENKSIKVPADFYKFVRPFSIILWPCVVSLFILLYLTTFIVVVKTLLRKKS